MRIESLILKAILFFNIATWGLYIISPISVKSGFHVLNIIYIALNIFMMYKGFKNGGLKSDNAIHGYSMSLNTRFFRFCLVFYLLTFLLRYAYLLYLPPFDISGLIKRISIGIADPYLARKIDHGSHTLPWTVFFITSVVDSAFFIVSFLSWKKLKMTFRIIVIILLAIDIAYWMGTATNFGVIMMVSCLILSIMMQLNQDYLVKKDVVKYFSLGIIALSIVLLVFNYNMQGRSGGSFDNLSDPGSFLALSNVTINDSNPFFSALPFSTQVFLLFIISYLTQGYMFLEYIYGLHFHWGGFFGNNPALQSIAQDFLGFNPDLGSYQAQMEIYGVDPSINWHSCYLWLANDFTLIGVPIVVYFVSKMTSFALYSYRKSNDLLTGLIFIMFANMLLFMFANNNYISSVFYTFMFVFPYWFFTRYKKI